MIVCLCNRVSDRDIRRVVQIQGVRDFEVLKDPDACRLVLRLLP